MKRLSLFPHVPKSKPTWQALATRSLDGSGVKVGRRIDLSTPIVSVQDGPRMTLSNLGGKKAAPFRKGGKRRAKIIAAKAAVRKAKGADLSNVDLAFNRSEKRDAIGRWTRGGELKKAMAEAPAGTKFHFQGEDSADNRVLTKNLNGTFDGPNGRVSHEKATKDVSFGTRARVMTPADQRIAHDRLMVERDRQALAGSETKVKGVRKLHEALKAAPAGAQVHVKNVRGVQGNRANDRVYTKNSDGSFDGHVLSAKAGKRYIGKHSAAQVAQHLHHEARTTIKVGRKK